MYTDMPSLVMHERTANNANDACEEHMMDIILSDAMMQSYVEYIIFQTRGGPRLDGELGAFPYYYSET